MKKEFNKEIIKLSPNRINTLLVIQNNHFFESEILNRLIDFIEKMQVFEKVFENVFEKHYSLHKLIKQSFSYCNSLFILRSAIESNKIDEKLLFENFSSLTWLYCKNIIFLINEENENNKEKNYKLGSDFLEANINFLSFLRNLFSHFYLDSITIHKLLNSIYEFNFYNNKIINDLVNSKPNKLCMFDLLNSNKKTITLCKIQNKYLDEAILNFNKNDFDENMEEVLYVKDVDKIRIKLYDEIFKNFQENKINIFSNPDHWITYLRLSDNYFLRIEMYPFIHSLIEYFEIFYNILKK
ncbi:unknown protein [Mesoplasma florum L1]|uniref:Uncharacterized protein n=2 Tax=Mesoplasma florum TaxID=2151 RepID=Q6F1D9_MESFL|nr:hypothetical protein [Mesoplasma florum]AAT75684.1 unknown protein [Mesoplasma florum L1]AGY41413.1 hypothetical protein mflW37_3460 [Mesoplasma florum W37]AVN59632.1 hypothetical protein CG008_01800 [Mesoplasma florum]AVN65754.1 hypothetical protein MflW12_3490 [Mesoplasma florum]